MIGIKVKVDENTFGLVTEEFTNGYMTTAGFTTDGEAQPDVLSITYDSDHADCLPIDWPVMYWLDDNGIRQKLDSILWENETGPVYRMRDGSLSYTITS